MLEQTITARKPDTGDHPQSYGIIAQAQPAPPPPQLLGESSLIQALRLQVAQFARSSHPVLIEGETGTGKELVAVGLHAQSPRAHAPFLAINCASLCADLLETQLFGHARGVFTGAVTSRAGFFEAAGEGGLFLDEIGELPLGLQSKLLRVLESGEYYRLGETRPRTSRSRIIASTNRPLGQAVRRGEFREDLYHRLGVLVIAVPPLRERGEDCLLLLDHFRKVHFPDVDPFALDEGARRLLKDYRFPGNVRELRNLAIRLGARIPGKTITAAELGAELDGQLLSTGDAGADRLQEEARCDLLKGNFCLEGALREYEKLHIKAALEISRGNLSRAARLLGINRTTLYYRLARLSVE